MNIRHRIQLRAWSTALPLLLSGGLLTGCGEDRAGDLDPWRGTLTEGLASIEALVAEQRFDEALEIADRMDRAGSLAGLRTRAAEITEGASEGILGPLDRSLAAMGFPVLTTPQRGEIEYARAVTLLGSVAELEVDPAGGAAGASGDAEAPEDAAGRLERAVRAFERARAAGGGASLDAVYDLGTLDLEIAESIRATIPEISGGPPPPPPSDKDAAGGKDDRDPLELARAAYLAAREDLVERLRMGGGEDARANVELVIRRLRELDELERQREEQQEQQDDQSEGDPSEDPQENEGSEDQEQDPSESEEQEGEDESESEDPSEEEPEQTEEQEDDPEEESDEQPEEEPEEAPEEEQEGEEEEAEDEPAEEERLMTAEERSRILERNREYQENGEELRRILRMGRKVPARRDW